MILALLAAMMPGQLPQGPAPEPVKLPHFPDRLHAFVWRNWTLVPLDRIARTVRATPAQIREIGRSMGLPPPGRIPADHQRRSYLTVIRRNWHLLPYDQLLNLLGWTEEHLAFTLREDDFLWVKLGGLKPRCEPLRFSPPSEGVRARAAQIARVLPEELPPGALRPREPLFAFVSELTRRPMDPGGQAAAMPKAPGALTPPPDRLPSPRYCYSYFALYGDPLLEKEADPYPDGLLARMARAGVDGVWLQGILQKLAPFPWDPKRSERWEERLRSLKALTERARRHGIGVWLYLNEPRALPNGFFDGRAGLRGVREGDYSALCTSSPEVKAWIRESVARVCRAAPHLAGIFTITASENLTSCWSHHQGTACPRCGPRGPAEVISEVNSLVHAGIQDSGAGAQLIAWDWGWPDEAAQAIIQRLPEGIGLQSVSEWSIPIQRGGVQSMIAEYSLSTVGPGPRALRHWAWARERGLRTIAKVQAACTWELSTVPYVPAVEKTALHALNLRDVGVDGIMLGWTLGGYPSPNLEAVAEAWKPRAASDSVSRELESILRRVAARRYGEAHALAVARAWSACSAAFGEFPYHGSLVYNAPLQLGPANLLWAEPTGYRATMVGFPYDDLDSWRAVYPPEVFAGQLERVAAGFERALAGLRAAVAAPSRELEREMGVMEACGIHFRSVAGQARFILARRESGGARRASRDKMVRILREEIALARRLLELQSRDSRLGFEASNQYSYVGADLAEKILCCRHLLEQLLSEP